MLEVHRQPLTVYRISMAKDGRSMWYDRDGSFDPVEQAFADIPMPPDARRMLADLHGGEWLSSVSDIDLFKVWFPNKGQIFTKMGFIAQEFQVQEYATLPNEVVFNRDTAVMQPMSLDLISILDNN